MREFIPNYAYQGMEEDDGVNHLRVDRYAATELGQRLAVDTPRVFFHPVHGEFLTIESAMVWYRLKKKDDTVRSLAGRRLGAYVDEQIEQGKNEYDRSQEALPNEVLAEFLKYSILSKPELVELFSENTLPFICYTTNPKGYINVRFRQVANVLNGLDLTPP